MKHLSTIIKNLALPCTAIITMAACSDYAPEEYEGNFTKEEYETILEYSKNFVNKYGKIDPQHNWGFEDMPVANDVESKKQRKTRGWSFTNSNIGNGQSGWVNVIKGNGGVVYGYENYKVRGEEIVVPGFPSKTDGKYYVGSNVYNKSQIENGDVKEGSGNIVGDVTNDEIVFVSRWFREHKNPESMSQAQLMDNKDSHATLNSAEYLETFSYNTFFVQNISGDKDRNETGGYKSGWPGAGMDNLQVGSVSWHQENQWYGYWQGANHLNNFNAGLSVNSINENNPDSYQNNYPSRQIMLYVGGEGEAVTKFYYHNSQESKYYDRYVVMHLNFTINGLTYDGYYLGFDYETYMNTNWQPDGYYNNWIMKISDALPQSTPEPSSYVRRVMCEDLGDTDDFDFNDLVFDVSFTKVAEGNYTANVTVRAVGGTLPIYIGTDMTQELHAAMGVDVKQPVNVGASNGVETSQTVTRTIYGLSAPNADLVPICVVRDGNKATLLPSTRELKSAAPTKICVPTTVKWMKERMDIQNNGYEKFGDYVGNRDVKFWESGNIQTDNLYE